MVAATAVGDGWWVAMAVLDGGPVVGWSEPRQMGQMQENCSSHGEMQAAWNRCAHGSVSTRSPAA